MVYRRAAGWTDRLIIESFIGRPFNAISMPRQSEAGPSGLPNHIAAKAGVLRPILSIWLEYTRLTLCTLFSSSNSHKQKPGGEGFMRKRRIHLINPKANSFTNRPIYFKRALYSPLAGLLAVAALIPQDQYEVVLSDENIEPIDYDLSADLVGISAMTSYVKRGYAIADRFRERGVPVIMGGVHPSFMPLEALQHADAVVVGEAELVMPQVLADLKKGSVKGIYKAKQLHALDDLPMPRYDLVKSNRYITRSFVQTSRGCHHGCAFCAEHLMNGLRFRFRPIDHVMREIDACGSKVIALNDADFFGSPRRAADLMKALKTRGIRWQAGVDSRNAHNDELLELAAESGCYLLSIGFESISRKSLESVHKLQNRPEKFQQLIEKIQSYGILVFGLFMFGFDHDDPTVFGETAAFTIDAGLDVCAFSLLTPYPGTVVWYEMLRNKRILSYDWDQYDQGHVLFKTAGIPPERISSGYKEAYRRFYTLPSMMRRFPYKSSRSKFDWLAYNLFFRKGVIQEIKHAQVTTEPTSAPDYPASPPVMPLRKDWKALIEESIYN